MRRTARYSRSPPDHAASVAASAPPDPAGTQAPSPPRLAAGSAAAVPPDAPGRWRRLLGRRPANSALWAAIVVLTLAWLGVVWQQQQVGTRTLTQKDIAAAVRHSLENDSLPSAVARAAASVAPSVVQVTGWRRHPKTGAEVEHGVGTGVVIVDKGIILTNLHVVQQAQSVKVRFADGLESTASVTGVQAENDLAVLQAHKIPDDLHAATLRSTQNLQPGETVVAIGFPFGIGPSVSAGVVSGLGRRFVSPDSGEKLTNLIQFDAAANPGNSGGPLITLDGEVVGIVTAILNPTPARTFLGIGFAVPIENAASAVGMPPF